MARTFYVDLHMVNISANPHPDGTYEALLRRAFAKKQPIEIRGDRYALMTDIAWNRSKETGQRTSAYGTVSTFTDIDTDAPWLNQNTGRAADDEDTNKIVIPEAIRPHFAQFQFYFDFERHLLAFQGISRMRKKTGGFKVYKLSPLLMKTYLSALFEMVKHNIDDINVTVVPDPAKLTQILSSGNIREITMVTTAPNSDNIATERGRVHKRFRRLKAKRKVERYIAAGKNGIEPDDEMSTAAKVAELDGHVAARVGTSEGVIDLSTSDTPLAERISVDTNIAPEETSIKHAMRNLIRQLD